MRGGSIRFPIVWIFVCTLAWAQQPQQPQQPQPSQTPADPATITVRVERVHHPFVVTDDKGRFVTDLKPTDFEVYEDGKKVKVDFFTGVAQPPLRVGLLMDTSNSVRLMFKGEQEAAIDFVHNLLGEQSKHAAFLMTFDSTKDIVKEFSSDANDLADAIRKMKVGGGTALYDAIHHACRDRLLPVQAPDGVRRVLVLLTDGEDDASRYSIDQVINMAQRAQVSIYAISLNSYGSSSPGDKILERLAEETGGAVVYPWKKPPSAEFATGYLSRTQIGDQNAVYEVGTGKYAGEAAANLAMALLRIQRELELQYTIGYVPPAPPDGKFRTIKVVSKRDGVNVRARKGYFSTAVTN